MTPEKQEELVIFICNVSWAQSQTCHLDKIGQSSNSQQSPLDYSPMSLIYVTNNSIQSDHGYNAQSFWARCSPGLQAGVIIAFISYAEQCLSCYGGHDF